MVKVVCIIQARVDSKRLPGKTLMKIGEHSMIRHVMYRASKIAGVNEVVLTCPYGQSQYFKPEVDDVCSRIFEGPHPDVLSAYHEAAVATNADVVMRITGDCWSICPEVSEMVLRSYFESIRFDYMANLNPPTLWPEGLDTEVFSDDVLQEAFLKTESVEDRHHVTPWIKKNKACMNVGCKEDYSFKLSVDTKDDLDRARKIYSMLPGLDWTWEDLKLILLKKLGL